MKTTIVAGPSNAALRAELGPGEAIKTEPGSMISHSQPFVKMRTGLGRDHENDSVGFMGRVVSGFKRMLTGESFFVNTFVAEGRGGDVYLAPSVPGDIQEYSLQAGEELFLQGGTFLASSMSVYLDPKWQGVRGLFNREGFFFIRAKATGRPGKIFFHTYGALVKLHVRPDEPLVVDNGHLVAFTSGVDYDLDRVRGLKPLLLGGEGIVLRFEGDGDVWMQTRDLSAFAGHLAPFLPSSD